jgi:aminoglycoside phosphotransferase (APT) family kinase protein
MAPDLAGALRAAVESGDWSALRERIAPDAVLRTSNESGRLRIDGREAVLAHLAGPGPGAIPLWKAREWDTGVALTFEWMAGTTDRRRWYVRTDADGRLAELWSAAARPAEGEGGGPGPPEALLQEIGAVGVEPLVHGGNSGAALLRAASEDRTSFVLKRVTAGSDWLARATRDEGRTARLHEAGAFAAMPAAVEHGIVAVARAGDAAWVAMRDVSRRLLPDGERLTRERSRLVLEAAAALHRTFHGCVPDGAARLSDRLGMASPAVAAAERAGSDLLPKQFEHAWEAFAEIVPADVAEPVLALASAPDRLAGALLEANGAATLIHGDLRDDNLGFDGDRVVLIDWDMATAGTPTVDFGWYLAQDAWRIDATREELEEDHRSAQDDALSEDELELGMIAGLVQYGWLLAHSARVHPDPVETTWGRDELSWWVPRTRGALERLGGAPTGPVSAG